jgi:hypothetical protein
MPTPAPMASWTFDGITTYFETVDHPSINKNQLELDEVKWDVWLRNETILQYLSA